MSFSTVEIYNRALMKIGQAALLSPTDPSDHAVTLNAVFASVRDTEISANRWGFALTRKKLPELEQKPAFGYARAFQLPGDCLRLVEIGSTWPGPNLADYRTGPNAAWRVEGGAVLTDLPAPLPITYLRRVEDSTQFPASFVECLACKLAVEICERITGGSSKRDLLWKEYGEALKTARKVEAIQRAPSFLQDGAWMTSRRLPATGGWL